ncbi:ATP-dependent helicase hrq1 isoform X2 [Magnolia sinica]|uniref:ATP-dependent helicase hrq1 isoform X2 n=1 Tax=Magnolia sinica TaxID=86752 RepID=UPI00265AD8DB|nr:ATP-dependent helicase hrq1 isoform X2 [Magnolia sinica]
MAEERNIEIQVRSLDGESATVSVSPDCSIKDIKSLLMESFLPAKNSPNFHLFCKGAKMNMESQINNYPVIQNEFIVLVPFTKKNRIPKHSELSKQSMAQPSECSDSCTASFADSAWSDIMQDLSSLSGISSNGVEPRLDSNAINMKERNLATGESSNVNQSSTSLPANSAQPDIMRNWSSLDSDDVNREGTDVAIGERSNPSSLNAKRKRGSSQDGWEGRKHDLLRDILCLKNEDFLSKQNCGRVCQVLESVNCLSDSKSANCLLFQELYGNSSLDSDTKRCMCPPWLKTTLKTFTFLNIFSGFLQMRSEYVTWNRLKGAVERLSGCGIKEVSIADMEQLSLLCPKVVMVGDRDSAVSKLCDTIAIVDSSVELEDECKSAKNSRTGGKQLSTLAIVNAIKKREKAFKTDIWNPIKLFMGKAMSGSGIPVLFSCENLLISMKTSSSSSKSSEVKRARMRKGSHLVQQRCKDTSALLPVEMVEHLRKGIGSEGQIVHVEEIDARKAVYAELPHDLLETTKAALEGMGISRLYSHQALAQDQLRALLGMTKGLGINLNIGVYDGDTSQEDRRWLRDNARLLITNPDMLHMSVLPYHGQFQRILSNLRFVIIDEAHAYKGAFGCHTALIMRRLRRICCHVYSSDPSFVFSTATSANPREHAMELANLQMLELIENDGSPCGPKIFLLWNPPLCLKNFPSSMNGSKSADTEAVARRSSPILEASCLFAEMIQHGLRCIAFCKTRKLSELVLCYTREILRETAPHLVDSICAYRAGYIAQDRRRIEADFFGGKLRGVAATNALELGIDVGHIDATLHLGFPGSIASLWQQAGRAGRRERPSLAVYVAFEGPLDQYFMKFPHKLFRSSIESCQVDSHNQQVLEQQIACAALEHPLSLVYDEKYFGSGLDSAIKSLKDKGQLGCDPSRVSSARIWGYIGHEKSPSHAISIRAIETEKYKVIDKGKDEILEEIEESKAFFQVYEGAVYMHQGKTYLVKDLDLSTKIALCQEADLKYYTKTRDYTDIHVIGGDLAYPAKVPRIQLLKTTAQAQTCRVTTTWFGFFRIQRGSNQIIDAVELSLPKYSYQSQAVWIRVPQSIKMAVEIQNLSFRAGLHAASHALLNAVPLYIMCNSSDLGSECANPHETRYFPERILLYDQHPGGIGISAQVQPVFGELLTAALEIVTTCSCSGNAGCPNCVQSLSCGEYNEVLDKAAAILILKSVIEAEKSHFEGSQESSNTSVPM